MTFIEGLFGISLDGGAGTLELLLALIPLAAMVGARSLRRRLPAKSRRSS